MMQKKPGNLGRGLGALLSPSHSDVSDAQGSQTSYGAGENEPNVFEDVADQPRDYTEHLEKIDKNFNSFQRREGSVASTAVEFIPLTLLSPMKNQPRQQFSEDTLEEMAASIQVYGVLQPLIVSPDAAGTGYTIVAGERRWRASKLAGLHAVPCIVRPKDEHSRLELALIENIQREDLSAVDEARALQNLINEHRYSHDALAQRIGKDRTTVANAIRLLSLPAEIIDDLQQKRLTAGHARCICALDEKKLQLRARDAVLSKKLSVRQTEDLVKQLKKGKQEPKPLKDALPPDLRHLCDQFKGHLGTKVRIMGGNDKGKIEISYYTPDDLERIAELVLGNPLATRFDG